jgi:hypothetical protein
MLKTFIHSQGHKCMFLPKFHCELNPVESMYYSKHVIQVLIKSVGTGVGLCASKSSTGAINRRVMMAIMMNPAAPVAGLAEAQVPRFSHL